MQFQVVHLWPYNSFHKYMRNKEKLKNSQNYIAEREDRHTTSRRETPSSRPLCSSVSRAYCRTSGFKPFLELVINPWFNQRSFQYSNQRMLLVEYSFQVVDGSWACEVFMRCESHYFEFILNAQRGLDSEEIIIQMHCWQNSSKKHNELINEIQK